jgi:hypothetical protein
MGSQTIRKFRKHPEARLKTITDLITKKQNFLTKFY